MSNITNEKNLKENPFNKKVLLIDDDDHVRNMIQMQLEVEGFQTKPARDGRNILALAQEYLPDFIVCDIMMPGGGGYEVLRALQTDELTRKIPVLLISGGRFDRTTKEMMMREPNVIGYLDKPIHIPTFLQKIHATLNTKTKDERQAEEHQRLGNMDVDRYGF